MNKEWIVSVNGKNQKFKREALLNYAMSRWGLNKASSVGPISELIRRCAPASFLEWEKFYFENAFQKKKDGQKISNEFIKELGATLYIKLSEIVHNELSSITEEECIDYIYNLVLNRTYEGYLSEIDTIYGQLQSLLQQKIEPAPDKWDRLFSVDFFITVKNHFIGLQIKPISSDQSLNSYTWIDQNKKNHEKFSKEFYGKVFFIYSVKSSSGKKIIHNLEVVDEIQKEIERLNNL